METAKSRFGMLFRRRTLLLACAFLVPFVAFWWFLTPSYHDLYVPILSYHRDIWHRTSRATVSTDKPGVEYVLRRDGTAYTEVTGWQTPGDGLSYFDRWLGERGWQRTDMYINGDPLFPETKFLKFGETFAVYTRPGDTSGFAGSNKGATGIVTVAIWPNDVGSGPQDYKSSSFNVVMVTARPSLLRALHDAIDD